MQTSLRHAILWVVFWQCCAARFLVQVSKFQCEQNLDCKFNLLACLGDFDHLTVYSSVVLLLCLGFIIFFRMFLERLMPNAWNQLFEWSWFSLLSYNVCIVLIFIILQTLRYDHEVGYRVMERSCLDFGPVTFLNIIKHLSLHLNFYHT